MITSEFTEPLLANDGATFAENFFGMAKYSNLWEEFLESLEPGGRKNDANVDVEKGRYCLSSLLLPLEVENGWFIGVDPPGNEIRESLLHKAAASSGMSCLKRKRALIRMIYFGN